MWLEQGHGRTLLDIGAGDGEFLYAMRLAGWRVLGLDTDPVAAEAAKKRGVPVMAASPASLEDREFDAVTLSHVIEHVEDPVAFLSLSWKLVAPGGRLVLRTPNVLSLGHAHFRSHWRGLEPPRHLYLFSPSALARVAMLAGLSADHVIFTSSRAAAFMWSQSRALAERTTAKVELRDILPIVALSHLESKMAMSRGEELVLIATKPVATS